MATRNGLHPFNSIEIASWLYSKMKVLFASEVNVGVQAGDTVDG